MKNADQNEKYVQAAAKRGDAVKHALDLGLNDLEVVGLMSNARHQLQHAFQNAASVRALRKYVG